jgi:HlyD family secretion protein
VFVARNGKAAFVPVTTGIAGERYFEVLSGLQEGDEVITGPFASVRSLREGDAVNITTTPPTTGTR